jgi:hypothetical protein
MVRARSKLLRPVGALAVGLATLGARASVAQAEPYRLRVDAFTESPDPAAFVMLSASARERTPLLVDAEALVWTGAALGADSSLEPRGEAVIASVRLRDPTGYGELRFGRLMYSGGAVRPLHLDGAVAAARAPTGAELQVFGGLPIQPGFAGRGDDWLVGMRATQAASEHGHAGFSYWQERDAGRLSRSELGLEGSVLPLRSLALRGTAAVETVRFGLAEARVSATLQDGRNRLELFGLRRSPSLMMPATSLFASLGSYDADALGLTGSLRAAPRLEMSTTTTVERVSERPGATTAARAELTLDDEGKGAIGLEARRVFMPDTSWTGARVWARVPFCEELGGSAEVEVAAPDDPRGRGVVWPWGILALRWQPIAALDVAAAFEASSTPQYSLGLGGLLRASGTWGTSR